MYRQAVARAALIMSNVDCRLFGVSKLAAAVKGTKDTESETFVFDYDINKFLYFGRVRRMMAGHS